MVLGWLFTLFLLHYFKRVNGFTLTSSNFQQDILQQSKEMTPDFEFWPLPQFEDLYIAYDLTYAEELLTSPALSNRIVIALISVNLQIDSYLTLYIGYFSYLFETLFPQQVTFLIYQSQPDIDRIQASIYLISLLPKRSIFIAMEHGPSSFGINSLAAIRYYDIGPSIIYHLNHEQPWITNMEANQLDFTYSTITELQAAYRQFPLVIRNYYYEPLLHTSIYLPINPPYYSFLIHNDTSPLKEWKIVKASQRKYKCLFRGRMNYTSPYYDRRKARGDSDLSESEVHRQEIFDLYATQSLDQCIVSEFSVTNAGSLRSMVRPYRDYMELIAKAAFVLCPAGNNPETFRLREALEVGAIPLLVRSKYPERDFLQHELWKDYPGPIFSAWNEVNPYLQQVTSEMMDNLQAQIQVWFSQFQSRLLEQLKSRIEQTFTEVDRLPNNHRLYSLDQIVLPSDETKEDIFVEYRILANPPMGSTLVKDRNVQQRDHEVLGHHVSSKYQQSSKPSLMNQPVNIDNQAIFSATTTSQKIVRQKESSPPQQQEEILKTMMRTILKQQQQIDQLTQDLRELQHLVKTSSLLHTEESK